MDPIAPAPPPLQDDMGDETLEELGMTEEEDDTGRATLLLDFCVMLEEEDDIGKAILEELGLT